MPQRAVQRKDDEPRELEPVSLKEGSRRLGELANEAGYGDRRRPLTRRGKTIAAIVGHRDLKRLRDLDGAAK